MCAVRVKSGYEIKGSSLNSRGNILSSGYFFRAKVLVCVGAIVFCICRRFWVDTSHKIRIFLAEIFQIL